MTCEGKQPESYDLFALGVLDGDEREEIQAHLDQGCETCRDAVRLRLAGWSRFAAAATPEAAPSAALRRRLLESVGAAPTRRRFAGLPAWGQALAACLLLISGAAVGWFSHLPSHPVERAVAPAAIPAPLASPEPSAALRGEVARLTALLDQQRQAAAQARREHAAGRAALASAQAELDQARRHTAEASAHLSDVQAELDRTRPALADAQKARADAQARLDAALSERDRAIRRERDLNARINFLQSRVESLTAAANNASAQLAPLLRLAALASSPSLRTLRLQPAEGHAGISGNAFLVDGSSVLVYASGLPPLKPGRVYQLWLMRSREPGIVSGGIFTPGPGGSAAIEVSSPTLATGVNTVAVTDEPAGGSKTPTGAKFFIGVKS